METENIAREKKNSWAGKNEIQLHELQAVFPQAEKLSSSRIQVPSILWQAQLDIFYEEMAYKHQME